MESTRGLRVICIGAGITGLSVATALRPHVSHITLLDSAPSLDQLNVRAAGLGLYTCATNVLHESLGISPHDDVRAVRGKTISAVDWTTGEHVRSMEPPMEWYTAHWGALLDALRKKAAEPETPGRGKPADLVLGSRVVEVDVEEGSVRTEDGSVWRGDLIVGCEGVRSVVRKAIVPNSIVSPSGLSVYRFTLKPTDWAHLPVEKRAQIDPLIGPEASIITFVDAPSEAIRLVLYRCHLDSTVNVLFIFPDHRLPVDESTGEDWAAAGSIKHLGETAAAAPEPFRSIINCVETCGLWQLRNQLPLGSWSKGRAIILGDAAHPMLPFQAMVAAVSMEDAEALRYALKEAKFDGSKDGIDKALKRVFGLRWMRCSLIQHFSNMGPFDQDSMHKAASWSVGLQAKKAKEGADRHNMVPSIQVGVDDPMHLKMRESVERHASKFDAKSTSVWAWDYLDTEDWLNRRPEFVLEGPFT